MKKSILILFLSVTGWLPAYLVMAQPVRGAWLLGSGGEDNLRNIILPYNDGTVCHAGLFSGTSYHIGPYDLTNPGSESFFIMRFNTDGNKNGMWIQQLCTDGTMSLLDVFLDNAGNAHVTGSFSGDSIYLRTSMYGRASLVDTYRPGSDKLFYLILASNGDIVSLTAPVPFDNKCDYFPFHVAWSKEGNMALCGYFFGDTLHTGSVVLKDTLGLNTFFLLYFDNSGQPLWGTTNGVANSTGEDYLDFSPGNLDLLPDGSVTVAGVYTGNITPVFGTDELPVPAEKNFFLARYDPSGAFQWSRYGVMDTYSEINILQLEHSLSGEIYLTGNFTEGSITFAPETLFHPDYGPALFLFKFDNSGNTMWSMAYSVTNEGTKGGTAKTGEAGPGTFLARLLLDSRDDLYLTGWYNKDTLTFPLEGDTILLTPGHSSDQYLVKYHPGGTFAWAKNITANCQVTPPAMVNSSDEIFIAATYRDSLFLREDTIPLADADSAAYILGFSGDGALIYQNTVTNQMPGKPPPTADMILSAKKHAIYLTGSYQGAITIDNRKLSGFYPENIYLTRLAPNTLLEGNVLLHSGDPVTQGFVYLYTVSPPSEPSLLEVAGINTEGHYAFTDISFGDYFLEVRPNSTDYPNAFTTWYEKGATMEEADTLHFLTDTLAVTPVVVNELLDTFEILSGNVTDTAGNVVYGYALLYLLNPYGEATVADSVMLDDGGNFVFHEITDGNYIIYFFADTSIWPDAVGTYYGDVAFWAEADTVHLSADTITGLHITMLEVPMQLDGDGRVEGSLYREDEAKSVSSVTGEPVKKIKVILIRKDKSSGEIVAWVYTDDEGHYVFQNVPDGSYQIIIDIPGLPQDSTYTVDITVENNVISGLDFVVTKDKIIMAKATGIFHPAAGRLELTVWPNPTNGPVTLRMAKDEEAVITLYNSQGSVVWRSAWQKGRERMQTDLSGLPSGIYYLQVTGRQRTGIRKVILQH